MGSLGTQEMVVIFVLALLLFGPKKLPELGKTLAKALGEFRRASTELKSTFEREMNAIERETDSLKEASQHYQDQIYNHEDSSYYDHGAYGHDSYDSNTADTSSTHVSASATQGAEPTTATETGSTPVEHAAATTPQITPAEGAVPQIAENHGHPTSGKEASDSQAVKS
jgi:sec-independent protein translocase protein TatA